MSIHAAVAALDKEIEAIDKKRARLVSLRDALVVEEGAEALPASSAAVKGKPGPKPGSKKKTGAKPEPKPGTKKAAAVKGAMTSLKAATPKKRVMSAEAKKKISEAAKARWAQKAKANKAS